MSLVLLQNYRRLTVPPRRFLGFVAMNVFSWHSLIGPVLILFARKIDMPPSWVGFIVSFMPLSMLFAFFTVPLVESVGPRRLMLWTWTGRCVWTLSAFALPWVLLHYPPHYGWLLLMFSVLGFCCIRAIGVGGWFPWLHEIVPPRERSVYFGTESSLEHGIIVISNLLHMVVLAFNPTLNHYLGIYAFGATCGIISIWLLARVPGGRKTAAHERSGMALMSYSVVLKDHAFLVFVTLVAMGFSASALISTASVMYMRDALGYPARYIMLILTANSVGVFLTVRSWSAFAEHQGTARGVFLTMLGLGLLGLSLLAHTEAAVWTVYLLPPTLFGAATLAAAFSVITHRAMLDYVNPAARVAYTNTWILGASLALGLSPIAAGFAIEGLDTWGYRLCFVLAGGMALAVASLAMPLLHDTAPADREAARSLNPMVPLNTVGRIVWISLGLHPATRYRPPEDD